MDVTRRRLLKALSAAVALPLVPGMALARGSMMTRPIPSSGEALPVVGLGTWQVFDVGGSETARAPLGEVLEILVAHGGSVVDTSPMYGRAEDVLGTLAQAAGLQDRLFYATKVWTDGRDAGIRQMNASMDLLRVPRLDLMQVHNLVDWKTHMKTLRAWKEEGRIRYIGITHYRTSAFDRLAAIIRSEPVDFVQLNHSIVTPEAEERLLPLAAERGVAVLVNRPYEGGQVFRRVRGREVPAWAAEFDCASWGQFFLKYILANPAVTCVIPGTSKPRHMRDNAAAGFGRLPDEATRQRMRALILA